MDISTYMGRLNAESQGVFQESIESKDRFGKLHHLASCLHEVSLCVPDREESSMLENVCLQLESASFSMSIGLYRQAMSSLRLAFELGLGAIYFSIHKMEYYEWKNGAGDIKWSNLIDVDNGVLSTRFVKIFFPDLQGDVEDYRCRAKRTYRQLSEYVHGNSGTWRSGLNFAYDNEKVIEYIDLHSNVVDVLLFVLLCRYSQFISESQKEDLDFYPERFPNLESVRVFFGRS